MNRAPNTFVFLLFAMTGLGCSSTAAPADDAGASSDATTAPTTDATVPEAAAAALPGAPTLKGLMKMSGGLHVVWKNAEKDCDTVEGERKTASTEFKVVFTVPGAADNKHDGTATEKTAYTYRLRCKRGDMYSDYSNEMSGTP